MKLMPMGLVVSVGTVVLAGAALAGRPTPTPTPASRGVLPRPTLVAAKGGPHLVPKWAPYPTATQHGDPTGCASWVSPGWMWDWGVKNTGTMTSQKAALILTCTVAGGKQWPAGQAAYLKDRLCTCNTRVYYVPMIPAGQTYGFGNPNGLRFRSFQGTDYVSCNDPNYPHAVVTAKVGTASATVHLCK